MLRRNHVADLCWQKRPKVVAGHFKWRCKPVISIASPSTLVTLRVACEIGGCNRGLIAFAVDSRLHSVAWLCVVGIVVPSIFIGVAYCSI